MHGSTAEAVLNNIRLARCTAAALMHWCVVAYVLACVNMI